MKKVYVLCLILCAFLGLNAQTVVLSEDFSAITDSSSSTITNNLDNYTQMAGWTGDWVYPSTGKVKVGKSAAAGFIKTPALDLSANNGQFVVTFDAKAWTGDATSMFVEIDGTPYTVTGLSTTAFNTFSLPCTGGTSATTIKFQGFQDSRGRFFLDNVIVTSQSAGPDTVAPFVTSVTPSANTLAVTFSEVVDPVTAQNVANYSLDNSINVTSATLNNRVVTLGVSPDLTEGSTYTLVVTNVADTTGNAMTVDTVVFTYGVSPEFNCATIADLRSKLDYTDVTVNNASTVEYKLTGEVVVTAVASYNNQKVIQDATGAILIFDPNGTLGTLSIGDKISGIYGTLTNYYGFLEFKPTAAYENFISVFEDVTPLVITLDQLNDASFMMGHQAELIQLNDVTLNEAGNTCAVLTPYGITQNGTSANAFFAYFQDAEYIGNALPSYNMDLVGFNFATSKIGSSYLDFRYYIIPRNNGDFAEHVGISEYDQAIQIFPNPVENTLHLSFNAFNATTVQIFDITGKMIMSQAVEGQVMSVNVDQLTTGTYFVRLTDGHDAAITKFVKR